MIKILNFILATLWVIVVGVPSIPSRLVCYILGWGRDVSGFIDAGHFRPGFRKTLHLWLTGWAGASCTRVYSMLYMISGALPGMSGKGGGRTRGFGDGRNPLSKRPGKFFWWVHAFSVRWAFRVEDDGAITWLTYVHDKAIRPYEEGSPHRSKSFASGSGMQWINVSLYRESVEYRSEEKVTHDLTPHFFHWIGQSMLPFVQQNIGGEVHPSPVRVHFRMRDLRETRRDKVIEWISNKLNRHD